MSSTYVDAATQKVAAVNDTTYAYRDCGCGDGPPLLLLQHFRGSLDNWDPALVDALAAGRRVITFDNRGVAGSSGSTPHTVEEMARDALAFLGALQLPVVDLLGFSIGSFVAQQLALTRPDAVRRIVLASAAPKGADGMHGWTPEVIGAIGKPQTTGPDYLGVFFTPSQASHAAGLEVVQRFAQRQHDLDAPVSWDTRLAQYDAVCAWGEPDHARLQRLSAITQPVFVANGDSDPMILPRYSHLLAGLLPDATLTIYPDAAHGFLFQHHRRFAADVSEFLARERTG
jgi:pimeloyl-ACP methyl ester carboxylesterase